MEPIAATPTEIMEKPLLPTMEVNVTGGLQKNEKEIVQDDQLIGIYNEILDMIRDDRKEVDGLLANFVNMVVNDGDASTSSKEALVNLVKIKTDCANNMSRVFDLLARLKLRDRSIPEVIAKQVNKFSIGGGKPDRKMLEALAKENKKKG